MDFKPMNLDVLSREECQEAEQAFKALADYAAAKDIAMANRSVGNIEDAEKYERKMKRIYNKLPRWAKW